MKKVFVLDTNILILDPLSIYNFEDNDVVIPIYVLEELDKHKTRNDEVGKNARQSTRELDSLRQEGNLHDGIELEDGGIISVYVAKDLDKYDFMDMSIMDNKIIACALEIKESHEDTFLVTNDINLRVRADSLELKSEKYDSNRTNVSFDEDGAIEFVVSGEMIDSFYENKGIELTENSDLNPNEMVILTSDGYQVQSALGRVSSNGKRIQMLSNFNNGLWGIKPKNKEQKHALDILMDDDINLVTLAGKAGTGKSLMALAAGLHQVTEENKYSRLLVSRAVIPVGKEIGFLPGSESEKLDPWMRAIWDNLEFMLNSDKKVKKIPDSGRYKSYQYLIDSEIIKVEAISFMRGRSIANQFILIDESQNLSIHEVRTILTRAGEGTKIVLTGDPSQVDNPYLDSENNGLAHVIQKMSGESIYGHTTLLKGERSALAELAAKLL